MDLRPYRLHLIGAALVLLSLLVVLGYIVIGSFGSAKKSSLASELSADFAPRSIPENYLFLPAEPEIIPRVILSRERRSTWSVSDSAPFWTNPQMIDQGPLNEAAEKSIKKVFDSVP
ncbi:MAG: hypothetical protein WCT14_17280 [Treponemataceae bacterium]